MNSQNTAFIAGSAMFNTMVAEESRPIRIRPAIPPAVRRRLCYLAGVSRQVGMPIGQAATARWAARYGYTGPGVQGTPVCIMMHAGVSIENASTVVAAALEQGLWDRGYGSPYSTPALWLATLVEWGHGPGTEEWKKLVKHTSGISGYDRGYLSRRDGRLHPDWALRVREINQFPDRDGRETGYVEARRLARRLRNHGVSPERARLMAAAVRAGESTAQPTYRLRERYGSPRANWWAMGVKAPGGVTISPVGIKVRALRALIQSHWDSGDSQIYDCAVRAHRAWGPLALVMVRAMGVHDAGQVYLSPAQVPWWEAYRDRYSRWITSNAYAALMAAGRWVGNATSAERAAELLGIHPASLPPATSEIGEREFQLLSKAPDREGIPPVRVSDGTLTLRSLERGDALALRLGDLTHCCQVLNGMAESCVIHGMTNPNGGFWVVQDNKGRVVAQSWVWRQRGVLVADNIETAICSQGEYNRIVPLYQLAAKAMLGRLGIEKVHVGTGYTDVVLNLPVAPYVDVPPGVYSDAHRQLLLAES